MITIVLICSILGGSDLDWPFFIRGDADRNLKVNISDAVLILGHLMGEGEIPCLNAADVNDDNRVNITDPIYLLNYLFMSGRPPKMPFPGAGMDPTDDEGMGQCYDYSAEN